MAQQTKIVYTVVFYDESRGSGPAGDCSHTFRSTKKTAAEQFAKGKDHYGQPATVFDDEVSIDLYRRWMREGKIAS